MRIENRQVKTLFGVVGLFLFGNTLRIILNIDEAIQDYTRALELEPGNATAYHNRGSLYERVGRCGGGQPGACEARFLSKARLVLALADSGTGVTLAGGGELGTCTHGLRAGALGAGSTARSPSPHVLLASQLHVP